MSNASIFYLSLVMDVGGRGGGSVTIVLYPQKCTRKASSSWSVSQLINGVVTRLKEVEISVFRIISTLLMVCEVFL